MLIIKWIRNKTLIELKPTLNKRAHLVLNAKNIPYNVCFINLTEKPEWFGNVSTLLKVPGMMINLDL